MWEQKREIVNWKIAKETETEKNYPDFDTERQ